MDDIVTQEFIDNQYKLIDKAREFFENDMKANIWLSKPSSGLQGRIPVDNPADALQLLGRLEHGVFG